MYISNDMLLNVLNQLRYIEDYSNIAGYLSMDTFAIRSIISRLETTSKLL